MQNCAFIGIRKYNIHLPEPFSSFSIKLPLLPKVVATAKSVKHNRAEFLETTQHGNSALFAATKSGIVERLALFMRTVPSLVVADLTSPF